MTPNRGSRRQTKIFMSVDDDDYDDDYDVDYDECDDFDDEYDDDVVVY